MWHNFLFLKSFVSLLVSLSVCHTFNQPTDISFLLLDFSFKKDLVQYATQNRTYSYQNFSDKELLTFPSPSLRSITLP